MSPPIYRDREARVQIPGPPTNLIQNRRFPTLSAVSWTPPDHNFRRSNATEGGVGVVEPPRASTAPTSVCRGGGFARRPDPPGSAGPPPSPAEALQCGGCDKGSLSLGVEIDGP